MQAFEFTTRSGTRLALFGESTNYSVDIATGVAERQFLKQSGAVHQWTGAPPRKFTFSCVCVGHGSTADERTADAERRIRLIADTILADPFGVLTHPRLGSLDAVVESVSFNENTGEARDAIDYQIRFSDDAVRNVPASSPVSAATAAVEKSKQATLGAANAGQVVLGHAQTLETACSAILSASSAVQTEMAPLTKLEAAVANALTASEAVIRSSAPLSARISALLAYRYARQAYDRAIAGSPTTIAYSVQSRTSLSRLIATVYGGGSRALNAQILALNRIPTPHAIPQGVVLRLPSPDLIKQRLRSVT